MCWHKLIRVIRSSLAVVLHLKWRLSFLSSSPPRSFDILTSAWEQRETKESQRGRFADRERNIDRGHSEGNETNEGSRAQKLTGLK